MTRAKHLIIACFLMVFPIFLGACNHNSTTSDDLQVPPTNFPNTVENAHLRDAIDQYNQGNFSDSYWESRELLKGARGVTKNEARLVTGISAYRLKNYPSAILNLEVIQDHDRNELAGPANATMGLIFAERQDLDKAYKHLKNAVKRFNDNENNAYARYHLGIVEQKMGLWRDANVNLTLASTQSSNTTLKTDAMERARYSAWSIQVGAYANEAIAREKAQEFANKAANAAAGATTVVMGLTAEGKLLYLVRIGRYNNLQAATNARSRLAIRDSFITAVRDD